MAANEEAAVEKKMSQMQTTDRKEGQSSIKQTLILSLIREPIGLTFKWNKIRSTFIPNFSAFLYATVECDKALLQTSTYYARELEVRYTTDVALLVHTFLAWHRILTIMRDYGMASVSQNEFLIHCDHRISFDSIYVDQVTAEFLQQLGPGRPQDESLGDVVPYLPSATSIGFTPNYGQAPHIGFCEHIPNVVALMRKLRRSKTGIGPAGQPNQDYQPDHNLEQENDPQANIGLEPLGDGQMIRRFAEINPATAFKPAFIKQATAKAIRQDVAFPLIPLRANNHVTQSEIDLFRLNGDTSWFQSLITLYNQRTAYYSRQIRYGDIRKGTVGNSKIDIETQIWDDTVQGHIRDYSNELRRPLAGIQIPEGLQVPVQPDPPVEGQAPVIHVRREDMVRVALNTLRSTGENLLTVLPPEIRAYVRTTDYFRVWAYARETTTPETCFHEALTTMWTRKRSGILPGVNFPPIRDGPFWEERLKVKSRDLEPFRELPQRLHREHVRQRTSFDQR